MVQPFTQPAGMVKRTVTSSNVISGQESSYTADRWYVDERDMKMPAFLEPGATSPIERTSEIISRGVNNG